MRTALLLIDIQMDYFPGGRHELAGAEAAAAMAGRVLAHARAAGWPVIHIQHVSLRPGAGFFLPGTPGTDIHPAVAPAVGEEVVVKHFPNSFRETPLAERLKALGAARLAVCGSMSHMCVDATVRAAMDLGLACVVAQDACATRDLEFRGRLVAAADVHAAFMQALAGAGAQVLDAAELPHA